MECFNVLTDAEAKFIKTLLNRFTSLSNERSMLLNQLTGFNRNLESMYRLEDQASTAMDSIQDAEKTQRILRHDIGQLEGEKADLEYEKTRLENALTLTGRLSYVLLGVFVVGCVMLGYLYMFLDVNIFFPATVMVLSVIVMGGLLIGFRRHAQGELSLNVRKQQRAVDILNTKNINFAYYTNYLRFSYKKYHVRNSQMLRKNLKEFGSYKHVVSRLDAIRKLMYETEDAIEHFLREKHLTEIKSTVEKFAQTLSVEDKKKYYSEVLAEKNTLEKELAQLDSRHAEIWDTLTEISEQSPSQRAAVDPVIQDYFGQVERMMNIAGAPAAE